MNNIFSQRLINARKIRCLSQRELCGVLDEKITTDFRLDYSNTVVESEDEAKVLAMRFRHDMNIGSDAIVSAVDLLVSAGVKIIEIDADNSFSGTCNEAGGLPVIVVNKNLSSERKRLTIFHELGR